MNPKAGDDAQAVRWLPLNVDTIGNLYASHGELLKKALGAFYEHEKSNMPPETKEQIENILGKFG